jgi:predicted nucleic acid-binding protein
LKAISNTSPLIFLDAAGHLEWLDAVFEEVWVPRQVVNELSAGAEEGYPLPMIERLRSVQVVDSAHLPSEWLALDLGAGELGAMALALESPDRIVLLDDALARRVASAAGLTCWGTLRVILEVKALGLIDSVEPVLDALQGAGMWLSTEVRVRVLQLAGESGGTDLG